MQVAAFFSAAPSAPAAGAAASSASTASVLGGNAPSDPGAPTGGFASLLDSQTASTEDFSEEGSWSHPAEPVAGPESEPAVEVEDLAVTGCAMLLQLSSVPAPLPAAPIGLPPLLQPPDVEQTPEPAMIECSESGEAAAAGATNSPVAGQPQTTRGYPTVAPLGVAPGLTQNPLVPSANPNANPGALAPESGQTTELPLGNAPVRGVVRPKEPESPVPADETTVDQSPAPTPVPVRGVVRLKDPVVLEDVVANPTDAGAETAAVPVRGVVRPKSADLGSTDDAVSAESSSATETLPVRGVVRPKDPLVPEEVATTEADETDPSATAPVRGVVRPKSEGETTSTPTGRVNDCPNPRGNGGPRSTEATGPGAASHSHGRHHRENEVAPDAPAEVAGHDVPVSPLPAAMTAVPAPQPKAPDARATKNADGNPVVAFPFVRSDETAEAETNDATAADGVPLVTEPTISSVEQEAAPKVRITGFHVERSRIRVTEEAPKESAPRQLTAWPTEKGGVTVVRPMVAAQPAETGAAPTASPALLSATPTLVQLSVDAAIVNRPATAPRATTATPAESANGATVSFDDETFPVETITLVLPTEANADAASSGKSGDGKPAPEPKTERVAVLGKNELPAVRENPAATRGKNVAAPVVSADDAGSKNFLSVDKQSVGPERREVGTRIAEGRPAMAASTLLSAASESTARESNPIFSAVSGRTTMERAPAATTAETPQVRSYAAAAVREVMAAAEKLVPPRTTIELRLQAFDQENVRVQLVWRDGTIHARFVTETPELQQALNKEWDSSMPRFAEKGLKFAEASFEQNDSAGQGGASHGAFSSEQHGRGRRGQIEREFPEFALPSFLSAVSGRATSVPVDLPSMATAMQPLAAAPRGLRVWA